MVTRTIDGASTLQLTVPDHRRKLLRSGIIDDYLWAVVDGLHYVLVAPNKGTNVLNLTFEDSVANALRQRTSTRKWDAATTTRDQMVRDMAAEVPVTCEVDPGVTGIVSAETNRSKAGSAKTSSWDLTGSLATDVDARRFSDGRALIFGGDQWLSTRYAPVTLHEPVPRGDGVDLSTGNPVSNIDLSIDYGQATNSATLKVAASQWAVPVGQGVTLTDMGPGNGLWLVNKSTNTLGRAQMDVDVARVTPLLPEPTDDAGEFDFLPGETKIDATNAQEVAASRTATAPAATASREAFVQFMLSASGDKYVWGANGPNTWDCSGLVHGASVHVGKPLTKPARSQWAQVQAHGTVISVAEALKTRGALLFRIEGTTTHDDHVVVSMGDGTTVEARGAAYGCGVFPNAAKRTWTNAGTWV